MFKIGEFARLAKVSIRLLRHYDDIGLLKPALVDSDSNYRYYAVDQLPTLHRILALKELGLSLEEIKKLLEAHLSASELRGMLLLKQAELRQRVREEQQRLDRVEERLKLIHSADVSHLPEVILKSQSALPMISVKGYVAVNTSPAPFFRDTYQMLKKHPLWASVQAMLGVYHCGFGQEREITHRTGQRLMEAVYVLDKPIQAEIHYKEGRCFESGFLPAYPTLASAIHQGADRTRHLGFQALFQWMELNGYQRIAPSQEIYLYRNCQENHLTEMQIPIEKVHKESL